MIHCKFLPHSLHTHCRKGPSSHCCSMITRIYGSLSVRKIFCYINSEQRICEPNISYWGNSSILSAEKITYENKEYILFGNTEQLMVVDVEKALHQYDKTKLILTDLEINHQKIQVGDTINNRVILKREYRIYSFHHPVLCLQMDIPVLY